MLVNISMWKSYICAEFEKVIKNQIDTVVEVTSDASKALFM